MKMRKILNGIFLLALFLPAAAQASAEPEHLARAEQYYQQGDFKKARNIYFKLAKRGDHYSQLKLAHMFADGEGASTDLVQAYAWAVLAAEGGQREAEEYKDSLLQRVENKAAAQEKTEKLKKKYGEEALQAQAERRARKRNSGACTGSRVNC